ncbi:hypothetical protein [Pedobacter xixiisoli]|uniref:DUF4157 domain-containing protein n=1 Tax=Pedobacter xixiisoli TaxID=1476464 RepID=A0A286ADK7_9SPHI|nr:hypothetical protein [Pedobacter xixiisoli]SOD19927.1 hypothetical protein SAMN06297358_3634 [Pedobacter xixiisoli]
MALFIVVPKLPVAAMAIYPFILIKRKAYKNDKILVNHEKIHHQQQIELLIIPFYLIYLANYLINLFRFKSHHQAYLNIIFEKEAYANEGNLNYNKIRKTFAAFRG